MRRPNKRIFLLHGVFAFLAVLSAGSFYRSVQAATCAVISQNLSIGTSDDQTGGQVTELQQFLQAEGYFSLQPTGYFGPITLGAVENFQASRGIMTTGFVGPLTRGAIQAVSCGTLPPPPEPAAPQINSLSPSSGSIGTTVTISGYGFAGNDMVMFDGDPISASASSDGMTITFTIPQYLSPYCPPGTMCPMYARLVTPGIFTVSVQNTIGTSNSVQFSVTSVSGTPVTISGLTAPTTLSVGQTGVWTVLANSAANSLTYSVNWGDANSYGAFNGNASPTVSQPTATFTHAYYTPGMYNPVFTVSSGGTSATVSGLVVVGS